MIKLFQLSLTIFKQRIGKTKHKKNTYKLGVELS